MACTTPCQFADTSIRTLSHLVNSSPSSFLFFTINTPGQGKTTIADLSSTRVFTHALRAALAFNRTITSIAQNLITSLYAAFLHAFRAPLFPTFASQQTIFAKIIRASWTHPTVEAFRIKRVATFTLRGTLAFI